MADFDDKLINEIVDKVKREIIANPRFIASLLKELPITAENIDPNLILSIMAATKNYKQPPVPIKQPLQATGSDTAKACAKPVLIATRSDSAKIVADILVGNNVYLWGKAGTGKTYLAQAIAECVLRLPQEHVYMINCSQWTSPNEIRGGQTIKGYTEGTLVKAWANGGMCILDELPKLDPNTAGILNEALAETAAMPTFDKDGFAIGRTIPRITNGRGEKIYKGMGFRMAEFEKAKKANPDLLYPEWYDEEKKKGNIAKIDFEFRFCVVGTGNTDMKTPSKNYSGNQRQDYSLVDRFVGSYYLIKAQKDTEKQLVYPYVYLVCDAIRDFLDNQKDALESVSLRTMLNFSRTYEQEMLTLLESDYADEIFDNDGQRITVTKTFKDSVDSFMATLPDELRGKLQNDNRFTMAYSAIPSKEEFQCRFYQRYGLWAKKPLSDDVCKKYGVL